jgi:hypothetical protein
MDAEIERAQIEEAIMNLERLARSRRKRRGRPPALLKDRISLENTLLPFEKATHSGVERAASSLMVT